MKSIDDLLHYLKQQEGSDLHLVAGLKPRVRAHGSLDPVPGAPPLTDEGVRALMRPMVDGAQWAEFEASGDLDFAYAIEGVARFRSNFFVQEHGAGAVFRMIPEKIVPLEALRLPPVVRSFAYLEKGLVLVTGPTGSGKSTTLAAIIDEINAHQAKHIVTIEDPLEFVHQNKMSVISHREVGTHTKSFSEALKAAVRQDADVVVVGEMRDLETISLAVTAAEMGTLVFGTLHTSSAVKTIDRLIDAFPADQQAQIRTTLAESLAGVIAQLLLKSPDGKGRCAANEILVKTPALPNLIRENKIPMIASMMQAGKGQGMQSMDDALLTLVKEGRVSAEDAYLKATNKQLFKTE